ncbi:MAG: hypothetical protein LUG18_07460 [Candidatus Azobacteroides sp.]|nr:hypothetical protein [Candidatus Azobacteroides sp.]
MNTTFKYIVFLLTGIISYSCVDDGKETFVLPDTTPSVGTGSYIKTGSSADYVVITTSEGHSVNVPSHSIPPTISGDDGTVTFSIEFEDDLPLPLPDCLELKSRVMKIEPFNFIFTYPLTIKFPLGNLNPSEVFVYYYNGGSNEWEYIPYSGFDSDRSGTIASFRLGYFILAENKCNTDPLGGYRLIHPASDNGQYFYTVSFSYEGEGWNKGFRIYNPIARTLPKANGTPESYTYIPYLPEGWYWMEIAREKRNSINSAPEYIEYLTIWNQEDVSNFSGEYFRELSSPNPYYNMPEFEGWKDLIFHEDVSWLRGRPDYWPAYTPTYGTGRFQATLTWINSYNNITDYDLHLYGPDGLNVYFANKRSGVFELDRDWISEIGEAVENIYSTNNQLPKGEYTVKVNHYSGVSGKEFNCRVLLDGRVVATKRSSIERGGNMETIYQFNIE